LILTARIFNLPQACSVCAGEWGRPAPDDYCHACRELNAHKLKVLRDGPKRCNSCEGRLREEYTLEVSGDYPRTPISPGKHFSCRVPICQRCRRRLGRWRLAVGTAVAAVCVGDAAVLAWVGPRVGWDPRALAMLGSLILAAGLAACLIALRVAYTWLVEPAYMPSEDTIRFRSRSYQAIFDELNPVAPDSVPAVAPPHRVGTAPGWITASFFGAFLGLLPGGVVAFLSLGWTGILGVTILFAVLGLPAAIFSLGDGREGRKRGCGLPAIMGLVAGIHAALYNLLPESLPVLARLPLAGAATGTLAWVASLLLTRAEVRP
jgi:hypothetical protein